jgi:hypothetical protein
LNEGYTEETWLVFPTKNGLISKAKQSKDIQILLDRGIDNLIGLNLFQDGMPADSKNQWFKAILEPCDDLGLDKIKEQIENDQYYLRCLTDYVRALSSTCVSPDVTVFSASIVSATCTEISRRTL